MTDFVMQWKRGWRLFHDAKHMAWENKQLWFLVWLQTLVLMIVPGFAILLTKLIVGDFLGIPGSFYQFGTAFYGGVATLFSYMFSFPFMLVSFFIGMFFYLVVMIANFFYAESFLLGNRMSYSNALSMGFSKKRYTFFWAVFVFILVLYPSRPIFSFLFAFLLPVVGYGSKSLKESFRLIGRLMSQHFGVVLGFYAQTILRIFFIMLIAGASIGLFVFWQASMIFKLWVAIVALMAALVVSFYSALTVILLPAYIARDSLELLSRSE